MIAAGELGELLGRWIVKIVFDLLLAVPVALAMVWLHQGPFWQNATIVAVSLVLARFAYALRDRREAARRSH